MTNANDWTGEEGEPVLICPSCKTEIAASHWIRESDAYIHTTYHYADGKLVWSDESVYETGESSWLCPECSEAPDDDGEQQLDDMRREGMTPVRLMKRESPQ